MAASQAPVGAAPMDGPLLGFVAGYVDTLCFIGLFGLFTAHVTGNFVLIGRALVQPNHDILLKLLVFPVFVLFVGLTRALVLRWQRLGAPALRNCMLLQLLLLLAGAALGWLAAPSARPGAPVVLLTGMVCAAAMAVQNAYGKLLMPGGAATTVMTGNVTQLVIELVDWLRGHGGARERAAVLCWPVLAFAGGAVAGAYAFVLCGFAGLLVPSLLLARLAWRRGEY